MSSLIKEFFRLARTDFSSRSFRFSLVLSVVNYFPGRSGALLRTHILGKYIDRIGEQSSFLGSVTIISPAKLSLGQQVLFNKGVYLQASGGIEIGDGTIIGPYVKIWSLNHIFSQPEVWIPEQGYEYRPVKIGKNVWIGADVFIMPGVDIGDYCVISAGSVVGAKKYPPGTMLAGNPARKIGVRVLPDRLQSTGNE